MSEDAGATGTPETIDEVPVDQGDGRPRSPLADGRCRQRG